MVTGKNVVKVGDKVRTSGPFSADPTTGVVVSLSDGFVKVKIEAGDIWTYKYSEIKLLPVASATGTAESQPAPFTIEAGKYYRTRDGHKVGPITHNGYGVYGAPENPSKWYVTGRSFSDDKQLPSDLIAEWVDEPATETSAETANDNMPPVDAQQEAQKIASSDGSFVMDLTNGVLTMETARFDIQHKYTLVRTKRGYGFEIARHGDYVWVDTGLNAPIAFKATNVKAA